MRYLLLTVLFFCTHVFGQSKISHLNFINDFFKEDTSKQLLIIGESHSSAAGSDIYVPILEFLNRKKGLHHLLIEFGPSEAYFYNQYLRTGNEKYLNYTIYAGYYKGWREAWQDIYKYQQKQKGDIKVSGMDFDRTRTMGYALYNIFKGYDNRPDFVKDLMNDIKSQAFFKTYTIGYPTPKDIEWADSTKALLKENWEELRQMLKEHDFHVISEIIHNKAVTYEKEREKGLAENVKRIINESENNKFMLMIGRDHAYYQHPVLDKRTWLAQLLKGTTGISVLSGVMLFENSELRVDAEKVVTLFEIRDKEPWKEYYIKIAAQADGDISIIPLQKELSALSAYTDYIILVQNQKGYEVLGKNLRLIQERRFWWRKVSDLKFWDNAVAKQYGIRAIPQNLLIDPSGKIIAKNIRGEELQQELEKVLE